jgi:hypothetical protein
VLFILDPIFLPIPDPGVKMAPDPDPQHCLEVLQVPGYVGQLFNAETAGEVRQLGGPGFAQEAPSRRQTTAGQPARLHRTVPVLRNIN